MTSAATVTKIDSTKIRKEILDLAKEVRDLRDKAENKILQLTNLVFTVREKQLFREWINPKTKKKFKTFDDWLEVDTGQSKATVYRLLRVKDNLKLSDARLEKIGPSRCYEIERIARDKPSLLPKFIKKIEDNPDIPVYAVKQMVANVLAGGHFDSGEYSRWEFAVKVEDEDDIRNTFAVMQAIEPVQNPDSPSGRGLHLLALCQEYLSGRPQREMLKKLEAAGAFSKNGNSNFVIDAD